MSNFNIPAGPWSFDGAVVTTPNGRFTLRPFALLSQTRLDYPALDNIARAVTELPALLEALEALYARAAAGLDQSATHDGLENCDALAQARAVLNNLNRSN